MNTVESAGLRRPTHEAEKFNARSISQHPCHRIDRRSLCSNTESFPDVTSQVFISHSLKDTAAYSSLCLALDGSGISRWDLSKLGPGQPLAEGLKNAINQCDICIFLATQRSLESKWCLAEIGAFWGAGKTVIMYLADPTVDEADLPPQFRGNLWTGDAVELIEAVQALDKSRVRKKRDAYSARLGDLTITVSLGRIEEYECRAEDCLIALPANEFFDDDCIHDAKSALGAFMNRHFPDKIATIQDLIRDELVGCPTEQVEKKPGEPANSYGIGRCVFLNHPLSSNLRIALIAVTTQRADIGLRADVSYIFDAANSIQRVMANHRLRTLIIPVLGSGHGGIKEEVSLVSMLIAFGELNRNRSAYFIKDINIVVFRSDATSDASVSPKTIQSALDFASHYLG